MPPLFLTSRGVDRTAALSLYKALLRQCRTIEIPSLLDVVRNKSQDNRAILGVRNVKGAFEAGYEALNLLTKCNANGSAGHSQLQELLANIPKDLKKKRTTKSVSSQEGPTTPIKAPTGSPSPHLQIPVPPYTPAVAANTSIILKRPHPTTFLPPGRRRHIPIWVEANGIPFLRTCKPIPNALSCYLNMRIKHRQARTNSINHFEQFAMRTAQDEDIWDDIVRRQAEVEGVVVGEGVVDGRVGGARRSSSLLKRNVESERMQLRRREELSRGVKWTWSVRGVVEGLWSQARAEKAKNLWWSEKLKEVVEKEKALAAVEKKAWVRNRRREKREKNRRGMSLEAEMQEEERRFYAEQDQNQPL